MEPNWVPLEQILDRVGCEHFLYMGAAGTIFLYKHWRTRRYMNLDGQGQAYLYVDGRYEPIDIVTAIERIGDPYLSAHIRPGLLHPERRPATGAGLL